MLNVLLRSENTDNRFLRGEAQAVYYRRQNRRLMGAIDLNPTDEAILDELQEGRCTPSFIAKRHGYSRGNVRNRLDRLVEHDYVQHLDRGLYELAEDPREDE